MSKGPRILRKETQTARGCRYCADCIKGWWCPYEVCPYHELDGFVKYQAWLKANEATVPQIIRKLTGKA
jgi:hypothetical protein